VRFLATGNFATNLLHIHSGEGGNTANSPYSKSRIFSLKWGVMFFCAVEDHTKKHYLPLIIEKLLRVRIIKGGIILSKSLKNA